MASQNSFWGIVDSLLPSLDHSDATIACILGKRNQALYSPVGSCQQQELVVARLLRHLFVDHALAK